MTQSMTPYGEVMPSPARSRTMENAVTLMYCGAGLSVLNILVTVAFRSGLEDEMLSDPMRPSGVSPELTHDILGLAVAIVTVGGLFCACLWIWMAISNGRGRPWARVVATVLAVLQSLSLLWSSANALGATGTHGDLTMISLVISLLGTVLAWSTVYFLWHRESAPLYAVRRY